MGKYTASMYFVNVHNLTYVPKCRNLCMENNPFPKKAARLVGSGLLYVSVTKKAGAFQSAVLSPLAGGVLCWLAPIFRQRFFVRRTPAPP